MKAPDANSVFTLTAINGWIDGIWKVSAIELKKKKGKKKCCEKFRKGKRCGSCPMKGCA